MIYDFSKPKVRKNGKVLNKFELGNELKKILGNKMGLIYEKYNNIYTYAELKEELKECIKKYD